MNIPENLLYTKEHEWVRIEGKNAVIGIDDYAQSSLGEVTYVEIPKAGSQLTQFKEFGTVESVKAASDVYAPLSGKIIKVNDEIVKSPEIINKSPYEKGWFIMIEVANESEKANLLPAPVYKEYLKGLEK